jgi:hypothetical protein
MQKGLTAHLKRASEKYFRTECQKGPGNQNASVQEKTRQLLREWAHNALHKHDCGHFKPPNGSGDATSLRPFRLATAFCCRA